MHGKFAGRFNAHSAGSCLRRGLPAACAYAGLEVGLLFRRITGEVRKSTGGQQDPELSISLDGEFYFKPPA